VLVQKRVKRAQNMLARPDFSLSDVALTSAFSDQSHLTRHFRRMLGTTPREFGGRIVNDPLIRR
jgi:AraC family transcriptional regulator